MGATTEASVAHPPGCYVGADGVLTFNNNLDSVAAPRGYTPLCMCNAFDPK